MSDRFAARRPPTITSLSPRTRRLAIGAAAAIPVLLIGVLGGTTRTHRTIAASSPAGTR